MHRNDINKNANLLPSLTLFFGLNLNDLIPIEIRICFEFRLFLNIYKIYFSMKKEYFITYEFHNSYTVFHILKKLLDLFDI